MKKLALILTVFITTLYLISCSSGPNRKISSDSPPESIEDIRPMIEEETDRGFNRFLLEFENRHQPYNPNRDNDTVNKPWQPHYWGQALINLSTFQFKTIRLIIGSRLRGNFLNADPTELKLIDQTFERLSPEEQAKILRNRAIYQSIVMRILRRLDDTLEISNTDISTPTALAQALTGSMALGNQSIERVSNILRDLFIRIPEKVHDSVRAQLCKIDKKKCEETDMVHYRKVMRQIRNVINEGVLDPIQYGLSYVAGIYFPRKMTKAMRALDPRNMVLAVRDFSKSMVKGEKGKAPFKNIKEAEGLTMLSHLEDLLDNSVHPGDTREEADERLKRSAFRFERNGDILAIYYNGRYEIPTDTPQAIRNRYNEVTTQIGSKPLVTFRADYKKSSAPTRSGTVYITLTKDYYNYARALWEANTEGKVDFPSWREFEPLVMTDLTHAVNFVAMSINRLNTPEVLNTPTE